MLNKIWNGFCSLLLVILGLVILLLINLFPPITCARVLYLLDGHNYEHEKELWQILLFSTISIVFFVIGFFAEAPWNFFIVVPSMTLWIFCVLEMHKLIPSTKKAIEDIKN